MPTVRDIVEAHVRRRSASIISDYLPAACRNAVVAHLAATLDLDACRTTTDWTMLDDRTWRAEWLRQVLGAPDSGIATKIAADWHDDLNSDVVAGHFRPERTRRLVPHVKPVVDQIILTPAASNAIEEEVFPDCWSMLANELARRLCLQMKDHGPLPEWAILNRLFTISFFASCELERCGPAQGSLSTLSRSFISIRGSLVRLPEKVWETGMADVRPPRVALGGPISLSQRSLSSLLAACHDESHATSARGTTEE